MIICNSNNLIKNKKINPNMGVRIYSCLVTLQKLASSRKIGICGDISAFSKYVVPCVAQINFITE